MKGRLPHAVKRRLTLVIQRRVPMLADDASEAEWSAWADLQEAQAILAGWAGRAGERRTPQDAAYLHRIRELTSRPGVEALLGEAAPAEPVVAEELFGLLRLE
jgi:hypothetical protein